MNYFDMSRFFRVLGNDLVLLELRRILFASVGLMAIGVLIYLTNVNAPANEDDPIAGALFGALLLGGGMIFTSMIFNDMHHPLERFHYLTLPCSNLERFLSRYLITAPLYLVYSIVLFSVFEVLANLVCSILQDGATVPLLNLGSDQVRALMLAYFICHVFVFTGAVWFRSYALIKTLFASFVFWSAFGVVAFVAMRIIYWESFMSFFQMNPEGPYPNYASLQIGEDGWMWYHKLLLTAFLLWTLFLAFLGLKEHEVQDGL